MVSDLSDKSRGKLSMLKVNIWNWAQENGYTPEYLAESMGYKSPWYVEQVVRGWEKMSAAFIGRFVQTFPKDAEFFLSLVSEETNNLQD